MWLWCTRMCMVWYLRHPTTQALMIQGACIFSTSLYGMCLLCHYMCPLHMCSSELRNPTELCGCSESLLIYMTSWLIYYLPMNTYLSDLTCSFLDPSLNLKEDLVNDLFSFRNLHLATIFTSSISFRIRNSFLRYLFEVIAETMLYGTMVLVPISFLIYVSICKGMICKGVIVFNYDRIDNSYLYIR